MPDDVILLVSNLIPEGKGIWHLTDEDQDDFDDEDGDDYVDKKSQAVHELDLPNDAALEPGKLEDLQADNTPLLPTMSPMRIHVPIPTLPPYRHPSTNTRTCYIT